MIKKSWLLWLPAILWFGACQSAQKAAYKPEEIIPTEKSVLWKISGNNLKKPSFLLGTIHVIPKKDFIVSKGLQTALERSQRVTYEIDMKEMTNLRAQMSLITKSFMAGGKTLRDLLSEEDYQYVHSKMEEKGLPAGFMDRLKPMFLTMMFSSEEDGPGAKAGGRMSSVEMEVYRMARKQKLESGGLESMASQMAIFDSIPYTEQAQMLLQSLRQGDLAAALSDSTATPQENELDMMLRMYKQQDIAAMQNLIQSEGSGYSKYEEVLLNQRNRNWIPIMGRMMREKPTLFAVGAGHLGGDQGVIALLRRAGYRVEVMK